MLSNAFAAGSNGPGTTTSTHARCQEGARFGADTRPIADGITSSRHHHVGQATGRRHARQRRAAAEAPQRAGATGLPDPGHPAPAHRRPRADTGRPEINPISAEDLQFTPIFGNTPKSRSTFAIVLGVARIRLGRHPHGGAHRRGKNQPGKEFFFQALDYENRKTPISKPAANAQRPNVQADTTRTRVRRSCGISSDRSVIAVVPCAAIAGTPAMDTS